MAHTFTFRTKHNYDTTQIGITIPVELSDGLKVVQVNPKLDTGASLRHLRAHLWRDAGPGRGVRDAGHRLDGQQHV